MIDNRRPSVVYLIVVLAMAGECATAMMVTVVSERGATVARDRPGHVPRIEFHQSHEGDSMGAEVTGGARCLKIDDVLLVSLE